MNSVVGCEPQEVNAGEGRAGQSLGDDIGVVLSDGSTRAYVVTEVSRYPKTELPAEVFARDGAEQLVLITCGGEFDRGAGSYEDNVIAYARPA